MGASIEGVATGKLGLASHQNAVPLLQQLTITNAGEDDLADLVLELRPSLPFAEVKKWHLDHLASHGTVAVADRDVELREAYLATLQESMRGTIHLTLSSGGEVLAEQRLAVELLAKNQWVAAAACRNSCPYSARPMTRR